MDELVDFLKKLPHMYRLNVLDLGGCKGLKKRHLKSICKVVSLKYLSLRKTDVSRLRARHLQGLRNLETLDLRDTVVPPGDMSRIFLPKLKHLLAGRSSGGAAGTSAVEAAAVPRRIGMMRHMETLTRVQASEDGKDLEGVAKLLQLRKLGVVVHANSHTTKSLRRVITGVASSLRSLSIWATKEDGTLDISMEGLASFSASKLVLENLDIKGKCSNLPPWIKEVTTLANITLRDTGMKPGDLAVLGEAHGLRCLRLLDKSYSERALSFRSGQFKALKVLVVDDTNIGSIDFVECSAPMLEKIVWSSFHMVVDKEKEDPCSGTHHLHNLKQVELTVTGHNLDTQQQLSHLKQAMKEHANRPKLLLVRARASTA